MQTSMKRFVGMFIVLIGIMIFLSSLNIHTAVARFILPLVFTGIGLHFYKKNRRVVGAVFFGIAIILFLNINIFALFIAAVLIYYGYRMLNKKDKSKQTEGSVNSNNTHKMNDIGDTKIRRSLIGEYHLLNQRFELEDLTISHGIGDVKIDLTKAIISEGETVIVINGWIGDIDIYVPYDLDVAVHANVTIGDLEVLGDRQSGISRSLMTKTETYTTSSKKVKLVLSLLIGDIDVRYL